MKEIFDMWCPFCQFNFSYNWYDVDIGEEFLIDESNQMKIVYITERVRCPKCFTRHLIRKEILRTQMLE